MKLINGKYTDAKIFTDNVENTALKQIENMVNHELTEKTKVRIMPDVHAGKGSTIGTTIKLPEDFSDWKVSPNIVGVDIGCSVMMYKLEEKEIDLKKLDEIVNAKVPAGFNVHNVGKDNKYVEQALANLSFDIGENNLQRISQSLGTLGGGNHFIELGLDETGSYWLSVHSGSRGLGVKVANYHQKIAVDKLTEQTIDLEGVIEDLKSRGKHKQIQSTIMKMKENEPNISNKDKEMAVLTGDNLLNYINDMEIAQEFASKSRETMLNIIIDAMKLTVVDKFDSVHNFIEHDNLKEGVIRKGATSAKAGQRLVIPLNMRDGSIIAMGKGNADWNDSAPHGAGRLMSRTKAKAEIRLEDFKNEMKEVYSSSIVESTIDEAPGAYKPAKEILEYIKPTVDVLHIVKPVYNFKAK